MQALAACLVAATLLVLAIDPAWAISAEGNLAAHDRWRPGEGLQAGDWYTYMVCEAPGGCGMVRLGFEDVGERWNATVAIREIPVPRGIAGTGRRHRLPGRHLGHLRPAAAQSRCGPL